MTNNNTPRTVNVNNVAIPIATIISLLSFVMWATFEFAKDRQALKDDIKHEFSVEMKAHRDLIEQIKGVIITIRERQTHYIENMWTKKDHMIWCYEVQKRNTNFSCPDYNALKDYGLLGNFERFGQDNSAEERQESKSNIIIKQWSKENQNLETQTDSMK